MQKLAAGQFLKEAENTKTTRSAIFHNRKLFERDCKKFGNTQVFKRYGYTLTAFRMPSGEWSCFVNVPSRLCMMHVKHFVKVHGGWTNTFCTPTGNARLEWHFGHLELFDFVPECPFDQSNDKQVYRTFSEHVLADFHRILHFLMFCYHCKWARRYRPIEIVPLWGLGASAPNPRRA